ncbi:MAG: 2-C-methyl-D-erythritol 2,4-cyclodiphosphate synthase [Clostridia bacterium]|nr:2-C-methyl-D-erythritol 2,4-cyclodiphosphate synthase [Clostridia bacterium]
MIRVGEGYDVHRLVKGRQLIIGGVTIDYPLGLDGHSDADVLAHAITDAIFGSLALGDIGSHFPDTDDRYRGADSMLLLAETGRILKSHGFNVVNIDSTVIAQKPKMAPHINSMRENIARALGIDASAVSVKAKTEEGLGFTGRQEGIAARAVCLVTDEN